MKILFDLRNTGLGNGGGSQTLVKSANVLSNIGNDVVMIDSGRIQYTWNKLKVKHLIIKSIENIPNSDVVISTGFRSISPMLKLPDRCGKKFIWCRGWETWVYDENKIIKLFKNNNFIKIVNSIGLKNKLKKYDIDSFLIRPGHDFDDFRNLKIRDKNKIIIGGLYHIKHKTKNSDLIIKIAKKLKLKYNNIELHMFGTSNIPNNPIIDKYVKQPNIKEKSKFYNNIDIWLSTSTLEGLHICPAEAMLCGCTVIGNDSELSGTCDYLINNITGLISKIDSSGFINKIELLINNKKLMCELSEAGRNKIIELGDRKYNMNQFVELMNSLLGEINE